MTQTIEDLAKECPISIHTLNQHFGSNGGQKLHVEARQQNETLPDLKIQSKTLLLFNRLKAIDKGILESSDKPVEYGDAAIVVHIQILSDIYDRIVGESLKQEISNQKFEEIVIQVDKGYDGLIERIKYKIEFGKFMRAIKTLESTEQFKSMGHIYLEYHGIELAELAGNKKEQEKENDMSNKQEDDKKEEGEGKEQNEQGKQKESEGKENIAEQKIDENKIQDNQEPSEKKEEKKQEDDQEKEQQDGQQSQDKKQQEQEKPQEKKQQQQEKHQDDRQLQQEKQEKNSPQINKQQAQKQYPPEENKQQQKTEQKMPQEQQQKQKETKALDDSPPQFDEPNNQPRKVSKQESISFFRKYLAPNPKAPSSPQKGIKLSTKFELASKATQKLAVQIKMLVSKNSNMMEKMGYEIQTKNIGLVISLGETQQNIEFIKTQIDLLCNQLMAGQLQMGIETRISNNRLLIIFPDFSLLELNQIKETFVQLQSIVDQYPEDIFIDASINLQMASHDNLISSLLHGFKVDINISCDKNVGNNIQKNIQMNHQEALMKSKLLSMLILAKQQKLSFKFKCIEDVEKFMKKLGIDKQKGLLESARINDLMADMMLGEKLSETKAVKQILRVCKNKGKQLQITLAHKNQIGYHIKIKSPQLSGQLIVFQ